MSATDAFSPAMARTKAMLLKPFRWSVWSRIALLGLATGEFGGMSCNFNVPGNSGGGQTQQTPESFSALPQVWQSIPLAAIIALAILVLLLVGVMLYVNSIARFMLLETVILGRASLREQWSRWQAAGRNYFAFQLLMAGCVWLLLLIVIGIPLLLAWKAGIFAAPKQHLPELILGGMALFLVFFFVLLFMLVVQVMAKDFIVPQMAMEQIDFVEAWRRYWKMLRQEKGGYAAYLGLKLVMRIAAMIVFGIASIIIMIVLFLPFILVFALAVGFSGLSGLVWTPFTIALVAVAGTILMTLVMFLMGFINSPVTIFFPSYALHFFSSRYKPLYDRMFPPYVPPAPPPMATPEVPPPEPAGA